MTSNLHGNAEPPMKGGTNTGLNQRDGDNGQTVKPGHTAKALEGEAMPRDPSERDESADSGSGGPSDLGKTAYDDAMSDKSSTDRSEATDATYQRTLRSATPGKERDEGPAASRPEAER